MGKLNGGVASSLLRFSDFVPGKANVPGCLYCLPVLVTDAHPPCIVYSKEYAPVLVVRPGNEPEDLRSLIQLWHGVVN